MRFPIWWESLIERDFIYLAEFDPEVTLIRHQPFKVTFILDGKQRSYTPDFLVIRNGQKLIVEVKPDYVLNDAEMMEFFGHITYLFAQRGEKFVLVAESMIRIEPKLSNIKLLYRYARFNVLPRHEYDCIKYLREHGPSSLRTVQYSLTGKSVSLSDIYALLYRGIIQTNLNVPLGLDTCVFLKEQDTDKQLSQLSRSPIETSNV